MTLSQLIRELERLKHLHGDVPVLLQPRTQSLVPDPEVRETHASKAKFVVLNP